MEKTILKFGDIKIKKKKKKKFTNTKKPISMKNIDINNRY